MKKILKLLSVALIGVCCTSCVEEIDTPNRGPQANPEKEVAGVYEGTWTITFTDDTETSVYSIPGTMTLAPDQAGTAYKGMMTSYAVVEEQPLLDHQLTTAVNIAPINTAGRYLVYNSVVPNGFDKDITVPKLNEEGTAFEETLLSMGSVIIGYVLPSDRKTEADAFPAGADKMLTISFTYNYQYDGGTLKRPKKKDCVQDYTFVGYKK